MMLRRIAEKASKVGTSLHGIAGNAGRIREQADWMRDRSREAKDRVAPYLPSIEQIQRWATENAARHR